MHPRFNIHFDSTDSTPNETDWHVVREHTTRLSLRTESPVRVDRVAMGKALVADPNYPSAAIRRALAERLLSVL